MNENTSLPIFQQTASIFYGTAYDIKDIKSSCFFLLQTSEKQVYKVFYNKKLSIKDYDQVCVKGRIFVDNTHQQNDYTSDDTISAFEVSKVQKTQKHYPFNELNIHTKMSTFNSIIDPQVVFERLAEQNVQYAGFTDINTVSNLPLIEELGKKHNIKTIYGCEMNVFDDQYNIFAHIDNDEEFKNLNFVVLDIETNGLDKYHDDILELAWVFLKDGTIFNSYTTLIKSDNDVKPFITNLTGINKAMLENGKNAKEVFEYVVEIFSDRRNVFVSQTKFDLAMLRHKIKHLLNYDFLPNFVDSKDIFRLCFPSENKLSVGELARSLGVHMDKQHRALDDAIATASIMKIAMDRNDMWNKSRKDKFSIVTKHTVDRSVVVWAKNKVGLKAIYKLLSVANEQYFHRYPRVPRSLLESYRKDLIVASSMLLGSEVFEGFFFEFENVDKYVKNYDYILIAPKEYIVNTFRGDEESNIKTADVFYNEMISRYSNKMIATSSPMFLNADEEKIAQALASFGTNVRNDSFKSRYLRDMQQMQNAFDYISTDIQQQIFVHNINEFISQVSFDFDIAEKYTSLNIEHASEKLAAAVQQAIKTKYSNVHSKFLEERVTQELALIDKFGFSDIYVVIAELLDSLRKELSILIGSRGTVGSSFVAFLLEITDVNALPPHQWCTVCGNFKLFYDKYSGFDIDNKICCEQQMKCDGQNIAFAIFAGLDGNKIPDIDLNVSTTRHEEVIQFVDNFLCAKELKTSRSGTLITLQRKNAFAYMRRFFTNNNIAYSHNYIELCSYKAIGCKLAYGQHPGGIMIFPKGSEITQYTPLQTTTDEDKKMTVTQFDHHFLGKQIFKLDMLAHDDPTTLNTLCEETNICVDQIPMNDKNVLSLFSSSSALYTNMAIKCNTYLLSEETNTGTLGLPEFGTTFVRRMLRKCNVKSFADIIRISGFAHGKNVWTNNAERLLSSKEQPLSQLIACRDDIFDFLSRYNMSIKDNFRVMEFIRKGGIASDYASWIELYTMMQKSNIPQWFIESCSKIHFLFPRAHASAYIIMAFRIAYFKIYHPINFYNAFLNRKLKFINDEILALTVEEMREKAMPLINAFDNEEKNILQLYEILYEMQLRNIKIVEVNIQLSDDIYFTIHNNTIVPPFSSIKGLGEKASLSIKTAREKAIFKNMSDFRQRTKINDTQIKLLKRKNILNLTDTTQTTLF